MMVKVIEPTMVIQTFSGTIFTAKLMGISGMVFEIIKHLLFSWLEFVWPWMKIIIVNTWCIFITQRHSGSHLVKFDSYCFTGFWVWDMAGDGKTDTRQTHRHSQSHRLGSSTLNYLKFAKTKRMSHSLLNHWFKESSVCVWKGWGAIITEDFWFLVSLQWELVTCTRVWCNWLQHWTSKTCTSHGWSSRRGHFYWSWSRGNIQWFIIIYFKISFKIKLMINQQT